MAGLAFLLFGFSEGWMMAAIGAALGYLLPDLWLKRKTRALAKAIENGLPDALDLIIVCIEAGSSLDQAIVKASDELEITHRPLAQEMRMITTEIRAGKPRLEAFTNFAATHEGARCALPGNDAHANRPVWHQRLAGASHSRGHGSDEAPPAR